MTIEILNRLITPLVLIGFAGGFIIVWLQFRELKSAGVIGLSYIIAAAAFILEFYLAEGSTVSVLRFVTDNLYLLSVMIAVAGIAMRYQKAIPWNTLLLIYSGTIGFGFLLYVSSPSLITKAYIISSGCSFMMAAAMPLIRDAKDNKIDRVLYYLVMISAAQLMLNAAFVFHAGQPLNSVTSLGQTDFIAILNFTVVLISLCIALCLLLSYAVEVISELNTKSEMDALTKALNRGALEAQARLHVAMAHNKKLPLTLVVADIDFFKQVNDVHGHSAGDKVIQSFVDVLKSSVRTMDFIGRIGGEEFVILLPTAELNMGKMLAETARMAFELKCYPHIASNLSVTASFGVAELKENETYTDLFSRADEALYVAKNSGRNKVVMSGVSGQLMPESLVA